MQHPRSLEPAVLLESLEGLAHLLAVNPPRVAPLPNAFLDQERAQFLDGVGFPARRQRGEIPRVREDDCGPPRKRRFPC